MTIKTDRHIFYMIDTDEGPYTIQEDKRTGFCWIFLYGTFVTGVKNFLLAEKYVNS